MDNTFQWYAQVAGVGFGAGGQAYSYRWCDKRPPGAGLVSYREGLVFEAPIAASLDDLTGELTSSGLVFWLPRRDPLVQRIFLRSRFRYVTISGTELTADPTDTTMVVDDASELAVDQIIWRASEAFLITNIVVTALTVKRGVLDTQVQAHTAYDTRIWDANQNIKGCVVEVYMYDGSASHLKWVGLLEEVSVPESYDRIKIVCRSAKIHLNGSIGKLAWRGKVEYMNSSGVYVGGIPVREKPILEAMGVVTTLLNQPFAALVKAGGGDSPARLATYRYAGGPWTVDGVQAPSLYGRAREDNNELLNVRADEIKLGDAYEEYLSTERADLNPFYRYDRGTSSFETEPTYHPFNMAIMLMMSTPSGSNFDIADSYSYDVLQHWGVGVPRRLIDLDAWETMRDGPMAGVRAERAKFYRGKLWPQIKRILWALGIAVGFSEEGKLIPVQILLASSSPVVVGMNRDIRELRLERRLQRTIDSVTIHWGEDQAPDTPIVSAQDRRWNPEQPGEQIVIDASDYVYRPGYPITDRIESTAQSLVSRHQFAPPLYSVRLSERIAVQVGGLVDLEADWATDADGENGLKNVQMLVTSVTHHQSDRSQEVQLSHIGHMLERVGFIAPACRVWKWDKANKIITIHPDDETTGFEVGDYVTLRSDNGKILDAVGVKTNAITDTTISLNGHFTDHPLPGCWIAGRPSSTASSDERERWAYMGDSEGEVNTPSGKEKGYQWH